MEARLKINDNIKTAMMLAVVLYHSCMFFTGNWFDKVTPAYSANYFALFAKYLNTFHVQTFAMASGFLFYALKKECGKYSKNLKVDIGKRAKRLLFPYAITIIVWVLPFYIVFSGFDAKTIVYKYVLGCAPSQLWFLPMLFWLFLLAYVFFRKHKPSQVGLITSVLISMGGGYILSTIGFKNVLQIVTAVRYAMYYYFGAYLYEKKIKPNAGLTILSMTFSVGGFMLSTQLAGSNYFVLKALNIVVSSFTSFAGIFMIYGFTNLIAIRKENKIWGNLKKNSFGIYLFHQQLIYPCIMLLNGRVHPVIQVAICFVVAICISSFMTKLLRKWKYTRIMFGL
ncbi:MAG: acyltransferase [Lachnospiraceae bacterium]|nr:acyltransferase [Lachnospiraceae bacterium]